MRRNARFDGAPAGSAAVPDRIGIDEGEATEQWRFVEAVNRAPPSAPFTERDRRPSRSRRDQPRPVGAWPPDHRPCHPGPRRRHRALLVSGRPHSHRRDH